MSRASVVYPRASLLDVSYTGADLGVAQWVFDHGKPAGMGTDTLSGAAGLYLPLAGGERTFGVLALLPQNPRRVTLPEQYRLLETFAAQIGLALERADFAAHAQAAEVRAETEAIRNALLASISHDLRTPLATIAAGAATLAGNLEALSVADRGRARELGERRGHAHERAHHHAARSGAAGDRRHPAAFRPVRARRAGRFGAQSLRATAAPPPGAHRAAGEPADAAHRRATDRAGAGKPARQRQQVHARGQRDPHQRAAAVAPGGSQHRGRRARPRGRRSGDPVREVPARCAGRRGRRHRARAGDLPHHSRPAQGPHLGREPRAARRCISLHAAAAGRARRQRREDRVSSELLPSQ